MLRILYSPIFVVAAFCLSAEARADSNFSQPSSTQTTATPTVAYNYDNPPPEIAVSSAPVESSKFSLHGQATVVDQGHAAFHSPYSGTNSMLSQYQTAATITSTLFLGWSPWKNTSLFLNPELSGGQGLSGSLGIAGFPNGEAYRIGNPQPVIKTARLYVQQIFDMGGGTEQVQDGLNQIAGPVPEDRLTVYAGKFGLMDWFDNNAYSHDPRSQFLNWALANSAAFDYPADTYGYTWGLITEYHTPQWAVRGAAAAEPKVANQAALDHRVGEAHSFTLEGEHQSPWQDHPGTFRLLGYFNQANMGDYDQAIALAQQTGTTPDITQTRAYAHTKYGFTSSDDIQLADHLGGFTRLSWNNGQTETWAYTEVDGSAATGLDWNPAAYNRPKDHLGVAEVVNVLSDAHRRYLADGGYGFIIGDGALHYGPEIITEAYYKYQMTDTIAVSPDAQFVINPAYNRDRGPVPIWGIRVHAEF